MTENWSERVIKQCDETLRGLQETRAQVKKDLAGIGIADMPLPESSKTLRDEFAIAALQGYLANPEMIEVMMRTNTMGEDYTQKLAKKCYLVADFMLLARKVTK